MADSSDKHRLSEPNVDEQFRALALVAKRSSIDDSTSVMADVSRQRIFSIAFGLSLNDETLHLENALGTSLLRAFTELLARRNLQVVVQYQLARGSYGSIIFAETHQSTTREELIDKCLDLAEDVGGALVAEFKRFLAKGIVVVVVGSAVMTFLSYEDTPSPTTTHTCRTEQWPEMQAAIAAARTPEDVVEAVNKFCRRQHSGSFDRIKSTLLKAFGIDFRQS